MNSSCSKASSNCSLFGVESTGLPATVTIARIWPSPSVRISSAITAAGYSPSASGNLRTRECPRPIRKPLPRPFSPRVVGLPAAGSGNITPPGESRFPVTALTTSTSHDAVVPKLTVQVPMRPYTHADSASNNSFANLRMTEASIPVARSTDSGVNGASARLTSAIPSTCVRRRSPTSARPVARIALASAARKSASPFGRIAIHSSACSAVFDLRGSTTTTLPPRSRNASRRPGKSGAVHRLPFDSYGFAPSIRM